MKKVLLILFILCGLVSLSSCSQDEPSVNDENENVEQPNEEEENETPQPDIYPEYDALSYAEILPSLQNFAWSLMDAEISTARVSPNFVLSPFSAYQVLAMIANGAEGSTRQEIIEALGFAGINMSDLNAFNAATMKRLSQRFYHMPVLDPLKVNNSFWSLPGIEVKDAFNDSIVKYYGAECFKINTQTFQNDVNQWCSDKTNGLIKSFPLSKDTEILVLNTIYYKDEWYETFDEKNNREMNFHNIDGTEKTTEFMHKVSSYFYLETERAELVGLQLLDYRLNIVLPKENVTISECIKDLKNGLSDEFISQLVSKKVDLTLPKFKVDNTINLNEALRNMGVEKMFGSGNFVNLSDNCSGFDLIQQVATLQVDEKGLAAAAATGGVLVGSGGSGTSNDPKIVVVDRPFIYFLSHDTSKSVLFSGVTAKL